MDIEILIYGIHAVHAALSQGRVRAIWFDQHRHDQRLELLRQVARGLDCQETHRKALDAMIPKRNHQGVVARCVSQQAGDEDDLIKLLRHKLDPAFFLVLDGVQDPHNLGACLRSADATGVQAVITPRDRSVGLTPAVRKVASGAAEFMPFIQVTNLARTLRTIKGYGVWIVGMTGDAPTPIYEIDLTVPLVLVLGAEGQGLRRLTRDHCDLLAYIPMLGTVESLNVSVANGICLFEALRQRQQIKLTTSP